MSELFIRINMSGEAFEGYVVGAELPIEAARILRKLASDIEDGACPSTHTRLPIRDGNGNTCGKWWTVK